MDTLLIERTGEVEHVTLNRPDSFNSLDDDLTLRLISAGATNALLLTGRMLAAERAFQLGLLADIAGPKELDALIDSYVDDMLSTTPSPFG